MVELKEVVDALKEWRPDDAPEYLDYQSDTLLRLSGIAHRDGRNGVGDCLEGASACLCGLSCLDGVQDPALGVALIAALLEALIEGAPPASPDRPGGTVTIPHYGKIS